MKKIVFFIFLVQLLLIASACSDQNIIPKEKASEVVETYGIKAFTVKIETKEQKEALKASFIEKKDRSEAEYLNKKDDVTLHGKKALKKIMEAFEKLDPNPEADETELITKTAEAFGFKDYKMIRLEVTFKGHDSKEIMFSK
ncbi:YusW family protein [Sporosarcina thermotolerans]|uniref:YusW family protein n=1 Tax=Sporosarcina thermotolerans TaxID=633404 RepID=A0AAW9A539_9BACL|nr:YusW family protein [Sporosarcina thermotolerans]MDW0115974.1 YusW family protein [Sporosarcina thermotolerans]WHT46820.1 YusW family protein [Sporosarcina thermotolerans]